MASRTLQTAQLGDLIAAVFDEAAVYSVEPEEVSWLATRAVRHLLRRVRRSEVSPQAEANCEPIVRWAWGNGR